MDAVVERAVDAYGGADRWAAAASVEVRFDASGLLFALKRRAEQNDTTVRVATGEPLVEVELGPDRIGVLDGPDVEVRDRSGQVLERRAGARAAFGDLRHWLGWDDLDFTYFAGAAWWTYLMGPIAWLRDDVSVAVVDDHTVDVTYDAAISTHCPRQRFHLDDDGRIVRHDYTAEVVSRLARTNHLCSAHRDFDGVVVPTRRRVHPAGLRWPTLVALDIHDFTLVPR